MIIGITGRIGSGKSRVIGIIKDLGGYVISCDKINHQLLEQQFYIDTIGREFDGVVIDNKIDKRKLREIIFNDKSELEKLNNIAHPIIIMQLLTEIYEKRDSYKNIFVEVPLLFELDMDKLFDSIWLIKADENIRIERVMARDKVNRDSVLEILKRQASEQIAESRASVIIDNNGDDDTLYSRIKKLYDEVSS